MCYASSAVVSFVWACLSRTHFQVMDCDWGRYAALFLALLESNGNTATCLFSWINLVGFKILLQHGMTGRARPTVPSSHIF